MFCLDPGFSCTWAHWVMEPIPLVFVGVTTWTSCQLIAGPHGETQLVTQSIRCWRPRKLCNASWCGFDSIRAKLSPNKLKWTTNYWPMGQNQCALIPASVGLYTEDHPGCEESKALDHACTKSNLLPSFPSIVSTAPGRTELVIRKSDP